MEYTHQVNGKTEPMFHREEVDEIVIAQVTYVDLFDFHEF